jgi:hypothetical protein
MAAQIVGRPSAEELAEIVGDAALAGLLRTKPAAETIPASVWWLISETLRTSVTIRRTVNGVRTPGGEDLSILIAESILLTEAALADLAEATGARPTPVSVPSMPHDLSHPGGTRPEFDLQLSILFVARMLVSHNVTTPQRLANTLAAHLRALTIVS